MANAIVIYKSKYGSCKQYALWIAEQLSADIKEAGKANRSDLGKYETIIYGGSIFASRIRGLNLIKNAMDKLGGKKLIVFSVGLGEAEDKTIAQYKEANFDDGMKASVHYFHLQGAYDQAKLRGFDKLVMSMMSNALKKKNPAELTEDERKMLTDFAEPVNHVNIDAIKPIVACAKG